MNCLLNRDNFVYACRWVDPYSCTSDVELKFIKFPDEARDQGCLFSFCYVLSTVYLMSFVSPCFVPHAASLSLNLPGCAKARDTNSVIIPNHYWPAVSRTLQQVGRVQAWEGESGSPDSSVFFPVKLPAQAPENSAMLLLL